MDFCRENHFKLTLVLIHSFNLFLKMSVVGESRIFDGILFQLKIVLGMKLVLFSSYSILNSLILFSKMFPTDYLVLEVKGTESLLYRYSGFLLDLILYTVIFHKLFNRKPATLI